MNLIAFIRAAVVRFRRSRRDADAQWVARFELRLPYALPIH
jgi:hypothetical protein